MGLCRWACAGSSAHGLLRESLVEALGLDGNLTTWSE